LLQDTVIPAIGNGKLMLPRDDEPASREHRVIDGTKHPIMVWGDDNATCIFLDRALVDASWTPRRLGYHTIEVELQPSEDYTVLEGSATKTVIVEG
jgi:hypothetical protein